MPFERPTSIDILFDDDGELRWQDGDLVEGPSDQIAIQDILETNKGEWKEHPVVGVGLVRYLNSDGTINGRVGLLKQIRLQLEYDNFDIRRLEIERSAQASDIKIDANRIR